MPTLEQHEQALANWRTRPGPELKDFADLIDKVKARDITISNLQQIFARDDLIKARDREIAELKQTLKMARKHVASRDLREINPKDGFFDCSTAEKSYEIKKADSAMTNPKGEALPTFERARPTNQTRG
jgi:hypothetical protein